MKALLGEQSGDLIVIDVLTRAVRVRCACGCRVQIKTTRWNNPGAPTHCGCKAPLRRGRVLP